MTATKRDLAFLQSIAKCLQEVSINSLGTHLEFFVPALHKPLSSNNNLDPKRTHKNKSFYMTLNIIPSKRDHGNQKRSCVPAKYCKKLQNVSKNHLGAPLEFSVQPLHNPLTSNNNFDPKSRHQNEWFYMTLNIIPSTLDHGNQKRSCVPAKYSKMTSKSV